MGFAFCLTDMTLGKKGEARHCDVLDLMALDAFFLDQIALFKRLKRYEIGACAAEEQPWKGVEDGFEGRSQRLDRRNRSRP